MIAALADLSTAPLRGIPCEFQCPDPVVVVDPFAAAQLVQIAYQAVQDALKRPGIQRIFIALSGGEGCIALTISDDGQRSASGRSLEGSASEELLRLRARAIGASLTISFQADRGTSILCKLPLHR
jgi:nitrate/nitrite-specific signal transduction histidine kinase